MSANSHRNEVSSYEFACLSEIRLNEPRVGSLKSILVDLLGTDFKVRRPKGPGQLW